MASITIASKADSGDQYRITIENKPGNMGSLRIRSWKPNHDPETSPPSDDQPVDLKNVKASSDGTRLACDGNAGGFSVALACTLSKAVGTSPPSVRVVRSKTFLGLGNGTDDYPIADADFMAVTQFIVAAGFSVLH